MTPEAICHDFYVTKAMKHLAIVRDAQAKFSGNFSAAQLSAKLQAALEQLADEEPAYKQALAIEAELRQAGFEIRHSDK